MTVGYAIGLGSSIWAQRKVRRARDNFTPHNVRVQAEQRGREAATRLRSTVIDLRDNASQTNV